MAGFDVIRRRRSVSLPSAGHDPPADHATSVPFSGRLAVFDEPSRPVEVGVHARLMASSDDSGPAGGRAGLQIDVAAEITCAIEHRRQASCSRATTARKPSGTARRRGSGSPGSKRCSGNYAPIACGNMEVMILRTVHRQSYLVQSSTRSESTISCGEVVGSPLRSVERSQPRPEGSVETLQRRHHPVDLIRPVPLLARVRVSPEQLDDR